MYYDARPIGIRCLAVFGDDRRANDTATCCTHLFTLFFCILWSFGVSWIRFFLSHSPSLGLSFQSITIQYLLMCVVVARFAWLKLKCVHDNNYFRRISFCQRCCRLVGYYRHGIINFCANFFSAFQCVFFFIHDRENERCVNIEHRRKKRLYNSRFICNQINGDH